MEREVINVKPHSPEDKTQKNHEELSTIENFIIQCNERAPEVKEDCTLATQILANEICETKMTYAIDMNEVQVGKLIGLGASAEVYRGVYRGTDVAVKKMRLFGEEKAAAVLKELKRELNTLSLLRHPNLVLFMGSGITSEGNICIITEFCAGKTLYHLLHESYKTKLSWTQRLKIALDVAKGMNFLHSYKPPIIHRDLKSLNLLLAEPVKGESDFVYTKITDFGLARFQSMDQVMTGSAGTFVIYCFIFVFYSIGWLLRC